MTTNETLEQEGVSAEAPNQAGDHSAEQATDQHAAEPATGGHAPHVHTPAQPTLHPELTREVAVEVDANTVSKTFRTVIKKYQKLARIPGFRVGKVPELVIKKRFEKDVRQEVLDALVSERFRQAVQSQGIVPVSQPQLTTLFLVDGQPLQFRAVFEVLPSFDVAGYDAVEVKKPEAALTEQEYQVELQRVMDQHGTVEPIEEDRELVDGDWAEIEFTGKVAPLAEGQPEQDEELNEPITGEDILIEVGGVNTLPAFSDALRGQKVGQEMSFEVTYPAEFGEPRLAGRTVSYDVKVKSMKRKTYPKKDTELAKQFGDYESWDDFETKLREMAQARKTETAENAAKEKMLAELIARYQFPVPESFVQQQIDARLDRGLRALAQQGMTEEQMRQLDFARLREAQRDEAIQEVKASLILDRIAEAEGVQVSDDEIERELNIASMQTRQPVETLRERMIKDGALGRMQEQMRREKTGAALYEKLAN